LLRLRAALHLRAALRWRAMPPLHIILTTHKQQRTSFNHSLTHQDYRKEMGEPEAGAVVTMHVLVRPAAAGGKAAAGKQADDGGPAKSGCGCTIS
jgi:hypothetical protein